MRKMLTCTALFSWLLTPLGGSAAAAVSADAPASAGSPDISSELPAKLEPPPKGNPLWSIPLRLLSATRERPLFTPSRRPPAPIIAVAPAAAPPPPPPPGPVAAPPERPPVGLIGTIIGEEDSIAIFLNPSSNVTTRVRQGEQESGWTLRSVGARTAILEKNQQTVTLDLPKPSAVVEPSPDGLAQPTAMPAQLPVLNALPQLMTPKVDFPPAQVPMPTAQMPIKDNL